MKHKRITFKTPHHQTPELIAYSYTYHPYVSIKVDGLFHNVMYHDHMKYYPFFPKDWIQIEGELYNFEGIGQIFYVFFIRNRKKKHQTLEEMSKEIDEVFFRTTHFREKNKNQPIEDRLINNIKESKLWLENHKNNSKNSKDYSKNKIIWFPKLYCKMDTSNWNLYIEDLNRIFEKIHKKDVFEIIKHDGLIITPNQSNIKNTIVKVKPRNELTIDLKYNGKDFVSADGTSYMDIITIKKSSVKDLIKDRVYRLGPNEKGKFEIQTIREEWKTPNSDGLIVTILYRYHHFFSLLQLKDLYMNPWYGEMIRSELNRVIPLFSYSQFIYYNILKKMNTGRILDIGCGSMGQYYKVLNPNRIDQYIGMDLDLVKLHEGSINTGENGQFKFLLFNYAYHWDKQDDYFPNHLWGTYYKDYVDYTTPFDNIYSIFSAHYANESEDSWNHFVEQITKRSKKGTKFFIMWIDASRISKNKNIGKFYALNRTKRVIEIKLPHRGFHKEPILENERVLESFNKNGWVINEEMGKVEGLKINTSVEIFEYISLINWLVYEKK